MILVTGGTGLVGSHLIFELIKRGKSVRALKRDDKNIHLVKRIFSFYSEQAEELFNKIEWVTGDVLDIYSLNDALIGVSEIYHCAAYVSFNAKDNETMMNTNIIGTTNMVNAALMAKIKKFGYVSSIASLGRSEQEDHINEETYWQESKNNSPYAISKYEAEKEVWRGHAEGLDVVIVNPSIIIGPGNWGMGSAKLFTQVWEGLKFYTKGINGYVDIWDVVKPLILLMEKDHFNERYILNAENRNYKDILTYISLGLNKKPPAILAGKILGAIAWRLESVRTMITGGKAFITKAAVRTANNVSYYSNEKIKHKLDYQFIPIEDSIKRTCELFLKDKR